MFLSYVKKSGKSKLLDLDLLWKGVGGVGSAIKLIGFFANKT